MANKSLKDGNRNLLVLILIANIAGFAVLITTGSLSSANLSELRADWQALLPGGLGIALFVLLNSLASPNWKARIIFWRWNHPLPSSRVFSDLMQKDDRISTATIENLIGKLPSEATEQSQVWYRLYQTVQNEPAVAHTHKEFLFFRDWCWMSVLALVVLGGADLIWIDGITAKYSFFAWVIMQYILTLVSARNRGTGFVTTALAVYGANK